MKNNDDGMGRRIFLKAAMTSPVLAALGCGGRGSGDAGSEADADGVMTMTTNEREARIELGGTGTATIDWGDDTEPETVELLDYEQAIVSRVFTGATSRTITITGENVTGLFCNGNQLTALDISRNTALDVLHCWDNQLTALDVRQNATLMSLYCHENRLSSLDVRQNTVLKTLICADNQLTSLDVSKNIALERLGCSSNQLTSLDVRQNTALILLNCSDNQLTPQTLNDLFVSLHANDLWYLDDYGNDYKSDKTIYIGDNPGSATCDPSIAEAKGWTVEGLAGRRITTFALDFGFKVTVGNEEDFETFKTYMYFKLERNNNVIFEDNSLTEYEFGDKRYPIVLQTGNNSFELLFEVNKRPNKNYLTRLFVNNDKLVEQDELPAFEAGPIDINNDGIMVYAGYWNDGHPWTENDELMTAYNPILYYSVTDTGLKLNETLTIERNEMIYGQFHGFLFSYDYGQPMSANLKFQEELKLIRNE